MSHQSQGRLGRLNDAGRLLPAVLAVELVNCLHKSRKRGHRRKFSTAVVPSAPLACQRSSTTITSSWCRGRSFSPHWPLLCNYYDLNLKERGICRVAWLSLFQVTATCCCCCHQRIVIAIVCSHSCTGRAIHEPPTTPLIAPPTSARSRAQVPLAKAMTATHRCLSLQVATNYQPSLSVASSRTGNSITLLYE